MTQPWRFNDPQNLASLTVADVLSGAHPVLYVSHDVGDGCWQFLTGDPVGLDQAKLVCLADIVALDPSLSELSDLRLGWSATRSSLQEPWLRTPEYPSDWAAFLQHAQSYTTECQRRLNDEFSLSDWNRYDYNQSDASLVFSDDGHPRVSAKIQIVGSISKSSGTWLWSWHNQTILPVAAESVHLLRTFGEQHSFDRMVQPRWAAEEVDGWEMTCVACLLLKADGVYRAPDDDGALFMVIREPKRL